MAMDDQQPGDAELLGRVARGDRDATDALIRRYANLVHGVAMRQTRNDEQLSADVSQAVFIIFIQKIRSIGSARALPGWFHMTTRYAVRTAMRSSRRREHYEQQAARGERIMNISIDDQANLELLDEAVASLGKTDRDLVLMRYMQSREVDAIATDIGITEQTARKRITRAIEKMRRFFAGRGAAMTVGGVTGLLTTAGSHSAPAAIIEASLAVSTSTISTSTIAQGVIQMMIWSKLKIATAVIVAMAVTGGAVAIVQLQNMRSAPADANSNALAPAMTMDELFAALHTEYALANGEMLRLIRAPFSPIRAAYVNQATPRGSDGIRALGIRWTPDVDRMSMYMLVADQPLDVLIDGLFRMNWYRIQDLDRIKWTNVHGDFILRDSATDQQKMDGLAAVIGQMTGDSVRFVEQSKSRICVVIVNPPPTRTQPRQNGPQRVVDFGKVGKTLGAPFVQNDDWAKRLMLELPDGKNFVPPTDKLDPADPDYEAKLRRAVEDIKQQIGGEYAIQRKELEVFVMEPVVAAMHPAQRAVETFFTAALRNDVGLAQTVSQRSRPSQLDDTQKILALNGNSIAIDFIEADNQAAIVISRLIKGDRGRDVMLITMQMSDGQWRISDLDLEQAAQSLPQEIQRFRQSHPNAIRIPAAPATRASQQ